MAGPPTLLIGLGRNGPKRLAVFPEGARALQSLFVHHVHEVLAKPLLPILVPLSHQRLPERSQAHYAGGAPPLGAAEREYLHGAFRYTGAGLALTAVAARAMFKSGVAVRMMTANPCASRCYRSQAVC